MTAAIAVRPVIGSTAGTTQVTVNLIEPNTMFRGYIHQFDTRFIAPSCAARVVPPTAPRSQSTTVVTSK